MDSLEKLNKEANRFFKTENAKNLSEYNRRKKTSLPAAAPLYPPKDEQKIVTADQLAGLSVHDMKKIIRNTNKTMADARATKKRQVNALKTLVETTLEPKERLALFKEFCSKCGFGKKECLCPKIVQEPMPNRLGDA